MNLYQIGWLMYLPKNEKNKYTIGKYLREQKGLRKPDPKAKIIQMPEELKQYIQQLQQKGLTFKGLQYALFYTKNGLPYPGLLAKQKILSNTIMLRVPKQLLLTTRNAFLSDIQSVFEQNPKLFSQKFTSDWQDNILLAYILYEYQKGQKSEWYNLIRNLPKDIDYAIFWSQKELSVMEDKWMQLGINQQRVSFNQLVKDLTQTLQKYPQFFKRNSFSEDKIRWIQSHLVTRCFGKYFQYTTMVPFAQLYNHQCVDVYYSMDYKPGNPDTQNQQFYGEKQLTQQELDEIESSEGSYDAEDFFEDDEQFHPQQNEQSSQIPETFKQHQNISISKDIRSIKSYILTFINFNDTVSLAYLIQIFKQLQLISESNQLDEQCIQKQKQQLRKIHSLNVKYVKLIKQYYSEQKLKFYTYGIKQKKKKQFKQAVQPQPNQYYFDKTWKQDKFDDFVMLCSTKDQFEQGSQVYFCYGRLPNKLLMIRYGIALQNNKYNHLFLRLQIQSQVKQTKSIMNILQYHVNMSKYKRFKLKRTKMCFDLLTYLRAKQWRYQKPLEEIFSIKNIQSQLQIMQIAREMYINELNKFSCNLCKNKQNLTNKLLNYHQYFCLVYKIQNQQILHCQVQMIDYAKQILIVLLKSQNKNLKNLLMEQKQKDKLILQTMMNGYFNMFAI